MDKFLHSNDWQWRLARTIVQAVVGVIIAYLSDLVGLLNLDATTGGMVTALVMAVLSPLMAAIKAADGEEVEDAESN